MKFTELNLNKNLQDAIRKAGYKEPSPIQEKAIPAAMSGRDLIACAQTGTGKTAAFALPILNRLEKASYGYIRALVLTPTRELAIQNFDNFKKYGRYMNLRTVCIYGGAKERPQIMQLHRGCDILVATPGRLIDYMDRGIVSLEGIEIFVLDEADRMLDMGFIHDIRKIAAATPEKRQTLLFSATMPRPIERLAQELLHDPESIKVAPTTSPAETVDQKICFLKKEDKKHALSAFLKQADVRKAIVFTRTKHGADRLVKDLGKENIEWASAKARSSASAAERSMSLSQLTSRRAASISAASRTSTTMICRRNLSPTSTGSAARAARARPERPSLSATARKWDFSPTSST